MAARERPLKRVLRREVEKEAREEEEDTWEGGGVGSGGCWTSPPSLPPSSFIPSCPRSSREASRRTCTVQARLCKGSSSSTHIESALPPSLPPPSPSITELSILLSPRSLASSSNMKIDGGPPPSLPPSLPPPACAKARRTV